MRGRPGSGDQPADGEVQDPITDLPRVTGSDAPESTASRMIHWDTEWHWDATYSNFAHQALGGHIVWGMTERILNNLLALLS